MIAKNGGGRFGPAAVLVFVAVLSGSGARVSVQEKEGQGRTPRPEVDPYTRGDPAALERAGYVSFGPFPWGDQHNNEQLADVLGGEPLIWVETAHFRIGSSLDVYDFPSDRVERKRLTAELERLEEKLPDIKAKVKKVDPWLRMHLYAMRLEDLYASFLEEFSLRAEEFPAYPGAPYMGKGRYLGMSNKFVVLLLEKKSALARYTSTFAGATWDNSYRYYFSKSDNFFFGISYESLEGSYQNDLALHYALVYGMVQNLASGVRGYSHDGPEWWKKGLASWFARRIDERCLLYTAGKGETIREEKEARWEPKVRARVEHGFFPSTEEMFGWKDAGEWEFSQHMIAWSRVDYIMRRDDKTARNLLIDLQEPVPWTGDISRDALVVKQFDRAFRTATGQDPAAFDKAWAAWVRANYAKK